MVAHRAYGNKISRTKGIAVLPLTPPGEGGVSNICFPKQDFVSLRKYIFWSFFRSFYRCFKAVLRLKTYKNQRNPIVKPWKFSRLRRAILPFLLLYHCMFQILATIGFPYTYSTKRLQAEETLSYTRESPRSCLCGLYIILWIIYARYYRRENSNNNIGAASASFCE